MQATQYEAALLGALIQGEQNARDVLPRLSQADFALPEHRDLFQAIETLHKSNTPIDAITLNDWMKTRHERDYFLTLCDLMDARCVPSSVEYYAKQLRIGSLRRAFLSAQDELEEGTDPLVLARRIEQLIEQPPKEEAAPEQQAQRFKLFSIGDVAQEVLAQIRIHNKQTGSITGVPCGIKELDDITLGFQNGELIIIGARPGEGKTTIGMNFAANIATDYKLPVLFVCLEMSRQALVRRYFASTTFVPTKLMRTGDCGELSMQALSEATEQAQALPISLVDQQCGIRTTADIEHYYRFLESSGTRARAVVVDHLHLLDAVSGASNPYEKTSEVSAGLKRLAARLDVPVIALCQLKRPDTTGRKKEALKPSLTDLRNSGNIEQDADQVIFVHRPHYHDPEAPINKAYLLLRKNREGETADVEVCYDAAKSLFKGFATGKQKLFNPSEIPEETREPPEEIAAAEPIQEPEEEEMDAAQNYEIVEREGGICYRDTNNGECTPRVWTETSCDKKIKEASDLGRVQEMLDQAVGWCESQSTEAHKAWAYACYEKLSDAYDRLMKAPIAVRDEDLSIFGF